MLRALAALAGLAAGLVVTAAPAAAKPPKNCTTPDAFSFTMPSSVYETDVIEYSARSVVGCVDPEVEYAYSLQIWQVDADDTIHSLVDRAVKSAGGGSFLSTGSIALGHRDLGSAIYGSFTSPTGERYVSTSVFACRPTIDPHLDTGTGYLGTRVTGEINPVAPSPTCPAAELTGWTLTGWDPVSRSEIEIGQGTGTSIDYQPDRLWGDTTGFYYLLNVDLTNAFDESAPDVYLIRQDDHLPVISQVVPSAPLTGTLAGIRLLSTASDEDPTDTLSYRWYVDGEQIIYYNGPSFDLTGLPIGEHTIDLAVSDQWGSTATWTGQVTVAPNPVHAAVALAAPDDGGAAPRAVTYDASASIGTKLRYDWTFGDGTQVRTTKPTVRKTWTTPCSSGTGLLTVTDRAGNADSVALPQIELGGRKVVLTPAPFATANRAAVLRGNTTTCDGAAAPSDGRFSWDFGDGTAGTGRSARHAWTAPGDYEVTLSWQLGAQHVSTSTTVHVSAAHAALSASTTFCFGGCTTRLNMAGSVGALLPDVPGGVPVEHPIASWTLTFGDGSDPVQGVGPVPAKGVRHYYAAGGRYHPELSITDTAGNTDTASITIISSGGDRAVGSARRYSRSDGCAGALRAVGAARLADQ